MSKVVSSNKVGGPYQSPTTPDIRRKLNTTKKKGSK